jgi:uncharacterized protein (DUF486 family)
MSSIATTVFLLVCSNVFMTFAWYGHLKNLRGQPLVLAIGELVITLAVFVPFAMFYMRQSIKVDFLWAGLCLLGAVYFIFRA